MPNDNGWSFFATTLHGDGTETLLEPDLPMSATRINNVLSGRNSLTGTIGVEVARLKNPNVTVTGEETIFLPYSTAIYAVLDGQIRGGGIVKTAPLGDPQVDVTCIGFVGYLDKYFPEGLQRSFIDADPSIMVRDLWDYVQGVKGSNIGLELDIDPLATPVRLGTKASSDNDDGPWTMNDWDTEDLGAKWDDLVADAQMDYWEEHILQSAAPTKQSEPGDPIDIRHVLHVNYPGSGRRRDDLRFVVGENVSEVPTISVDGDFYADEIVVLGSGQGRKMIRASWPTTATGRLHRPMAFSVKTANTAQKAKLRAHQIALAYQGDQDLTDLTVRNHPNAQLGAWGLGDTITVRGSGVGWAGDLNMKVRILGYELDPDDGDDAHLSATRAGRLSNG